MKKYGPWQQPLWLFVVSLLPHVLWLLFLAEVLWSLAFGELLWK